MTEQSGPTQESAFAEDGIKTSVSKLINEIQTLYKSDTIPWVVGYSGGKDSTAALQLVWLALQGLDSSERRKPVHVITTDTLVENPVVSAWVSKSLENMSDMAREASLPITTNLLTPTLKDTFWVNLIGRGYPAPRPKFRWCTERMKINPADSFISSVVKDNGEAIVVLGTRKAESTVRKSCMTVAETERVRENLNSHTSLVNAFVFAPIADWSNDDVWMFLMQYKNPWGYRNEELLTMYQGASEDGECPLVIDTSTPSCGDSRFGCWVCTLVEKDKSMSAMIQNDQEKIWMRPLLELRNALDEHDHDKRDFRRLTGQVQLHFNGENHIPGPYTQQSRADWLRHLLGAQRAIREDPRTPNNLKDITLISLEELQEIRRIWVVEKHEVEDLVPTIYSEVFEQDYPGQVIDDDQPFGPEEMKILLDLCGKDEILYQLTRDLLEVERSYRSVSRRANLFSQIDQAFKKGYYSDASDALGFAKEKKHLNDALMALKQPELMDERAAAGAIEFEERLAALEALIDDDLADQETIE